MVVIWRTGLAGALAESVAVAVAVAVGPVGVAVARVVAVAVAVAVGVETPPVQAPSFDHQLSFDGLKAEVGGQSRVAGMFASAWYSVLL
jgi:hypothetical protein